MNKKEKSPREKIYLEKDEAVFYEPQTVGELLHKYGTYNIQPTSDTGNDYPSIAQGLPKKDKSIMKHPMM